MSNLVDDYGRDWFNSKFMGAMMPYKGVPVRVNEATRSAVICTAAIKHEGKIKGVKISLPNSEFQSSDRFSAPDLGYRHMLDGKVLVFVRRDNTSYARAVSLRNIRAEESQLTSQVIESGLVDCNVTDDDLHHAIMRPNYIPIHRGIKLLQQRKMLSFAASPVIAVEQNQALDGSLNILAAGKVVGSVGTDGTMNITLPFASKLIEDLK